MAKCSNSIRLFVLGALPILASCGWGMADDFPVVGGNYKTDIIRRFNITGAAQSSGVTALGSVGGGAADQYQADPGGSGQYAINGIAGRNWQFSPSGGASGTATLRVTLNQSYTL